MTPAAHVVYDGDLFITAQTRPRVSLRGQSEAGLKIDLSTPC